VVSTCMRAPRRCGAPPGVVLSTCMRAPRSISCSPMAKGKLCSTSCAHKLMEPERG
jgi:hypothetical protein